MSFEKQMALGRAEGEPGRYFIELSDIWNAPINPSGGLVAAVAARAMALELDRPEQSLRTLTAVFAGQVRTGPVEVDVAVLRRGRSISQLSATVRNAGETAGITATAVFGASRPGFEFTDPVPPVVPPPEECRSVRDLPDGIDFPFPLGIWGTIDYRPAKGHHIWETAPPSPTSERLHWYRYDETPRTDDGGIDPLALLLICDTMPGAIATRVGADGFTWLAPSADLTVHLLQLPRSDWLLGRNRARHAGDGYASLEMELWDPAVGLVAYGTQVAFFTFLGA